MSIWLGNKRLDGDENAVHKTGNETITGTKTFKVDDNLPIVMDSRDNIDSTPSVQIATTIGVRDVNGKWVGGWEHYHNTDGTVVKQMAVRQQNGDNYGIIGVAIKADGYANGFAPTPNTSSNDNSIATTAWVGTHRIIAFQAPTAGNGYTWYRKYADGWVEQGGRWTGSQACGQGAETGVTVNLPITMSDTRYYANASVVANYLFQMRYQPTATTVRFGFGAYTVARTLTEFVWTVAGMAA